jgi:septal ring factor EnvC (AmiA/AmiB activator)
MRAKLNRTWIVAGLYCCCLCLARPAAAQQQMSREETETRLKEVVAEISQLQNRLEASREIHRQEQEQLRDVDLRMQEITLNIRQLDSEYEVQRQKLDVLLWQRDDYLASLQEQHEQLSGQLIAAYRLGKQSRLKLVLNQDSPAQVSRMLAYYDYLNRAQMTRISGLKEALTRLELMQSVINRELSRLQDVQSEHRKALELLNRQREDRKILVAELVQQINSEEASLKELLRNRQDLETLLSRLSDALADIPADLGQRLGVAKQKGRLPLPVEGRVRHAFGQRRAGGLYWQGWLIQAEIGSEVRAVAYGRVAFADWLRGYGLLMIIDHGQGFMSLYGNNEGLLKEVGDWIEPTEIISIVGASPGTDQGLYFELRKDGKAVDPAAWLAR